MKFKFIKLFLLLVLVFVSGWLIWVYAIPFYVGRDGCISEYKAIHIASEDVTKWHINLLEYNTRAKLWGDEWAIDFFLKQPACGGSVYYRISARTGEIKSTHFSQ